MGKRVSKEQFDKFIEYWNSRDGQRIFTATMGAKTGMKPEYVRLLFLKAADFPFKLAATESRNNKVVSYIVDRKIDQGILDDLHMAIKADWRAKKEASIKRQTEQPKENKVISIKEKAKELPLFDNMAFEIQKEIRNYLVAILNELREITKVITPNVKQANG